MLIRFICYEVDRDGMFTVFENERGGTVIWNDFVICPRKVWFEYRRLKK